MKKIQFASLFISTLLIVSVAQAERYKNNDVKNLRALASSDIKRVSSQRLACSSIEEAAMNFLVAYKEDMGISDPKSELKVIESTQDSIGMFHVKYQQVLKGIPVEGSHYVIHMSENLELMGANGSYKKINKLRKSNYSKLSKREKRLAKREPIKRAKKFMRRNVAKGRYRVSNAKQVVFNPENFQLNGNPNFAWKIELYQNPIKEGGVERNARILYVKDAKKRSMLFNYDPTAHQSAPDRLIRDCACDSPTQAACCQAVEIPALNYMSGRAEGDTPIGPNPFDWTIGSFETVGRTDIDETYEHLGNLHQLVFDKFGRNGGNNFGGNGRTATSLAFTDASNHIEVSLDGFGQDGEACNANFSSAGVIALCSGQTTPDVVGHEYAHAISSTLTWDGSQFTALAVFGEAGSLGESFSDFFGEAYQNYLTGSNDWLIERSSNDFLRSMEDPTQIFDEFIGQTPPDRYHSENYFCGGAGNGGVHINSGVPSKATYLMAEGGDFNDCSVEGIGIEKVEQIWYRALTTYFVPNETFNSAYGNIIQACDDLYDPVDCFQVAKALEAVEMDQPGACSGEAPNPIKPTCSNPNQTQGDYNCDGSISIFDYVGWLQTRGTAFNASECNADGNKDGEINIFDYIVWIRAFFDA